MSGPAAVDAGRTERLAALIRGARSVVVLTGAGISVPSGIPDFRSPGTGLWANVDPMEVAHIDVFRRTPARFWSFYGDRFASLGDKRPNRAHAALAELERAGAIRAVITQNVDRLHRASGIAELIEVHGSIATASCLVCGDQVGLDSVLELIAAAEDGVPRCPCGLPLKPDVTLFGEILDEGEMRRATAHVASADVLLCIGTSLEVYPVAGFPEVMLRRGGELALITQGATPFDRHAAVKLDGDVVAELDALAAALAS